MTDRQHELDAGVTGIMSEVLDQVVRVLYDFKYSDEAGEIQILKDDIYRLVEKTNNEWWQVYDPSDADGESFFVPAQYVEIVPEQSAWKALSDLDKALTFGDERSDSPEPDYNNVSDLYSTAASGIRPVLDGTDVYVNVTSGGGDTSAKDGEYINLDSYRSAAGIPSLSATGVKSLENTESSSASKANIPQELIQGTVPPPLPEEGTFQKVLLEGLPWDIYKEHTAGRLFYVNRETKERMWKPPRKPASQQTGPKTPEETSTKFGFTPNSSTTESNWTGLPPQYEQVHDNGSIYFIHKGTQEKTTHVLVSMKHYRHHHKAAASCPLSSSSRALPSLAMTLHSCHMKSSKLNGSVSARASSCGGECMTEECKCTELKYLFFHHLTVLWCMGFAWDYKISTDHCCQICCVVDDSIRRLFTFCAGSLPAHGGQMLGSQHVKLLFVLPFYSNDLVIPIVSFLDFHVLGHFISCKEVSEGSVAVVSEKETVAKVEIRTHELLAHISWRIVNIWLWKSLVDKVGRQYFHKLGSSDTQWTLPTSSETESKEFVSQFSDILKGAEQINEQTVQQQDVNWEAQGHRMSTFGGQQGPLSRSTKAASTYGQLEAAPKAGNRASTLPANFTVARPAPVAHERRLSPSNTSSRPGHLVPSPTSIRPAIPAQEEVLEGYVNKAKIMDTGKKKVKKNWTQIYLVLRGSNLIFYKDQKSATQDGRNEGVVSLQGAHVEFNPPKDLTSKKNTILLQASSGNFFLFQSDNEKSIREWFVRMKIVANDVSPVFDPSPIGFDFKEDKKEDKKSEKTTTRSISSDDTVDKNKNLVGIRAKLLSLISRRPTQEDLYKRGIIKDAVFGSRLNELCDKERMHVPKFVHHCIAAVESKGLLQDGLYRVSGNLAEIQRLRCAVDKDDNYNLYDAQWDVHVLTGALKLFFRELKEPLFPFNMYSTFIQAISKDSAKDKLTSFKKAVSDLPRCNYFTLKELLQHLC
ncbi:rho GTPase-activating protein 15, partial [Plakobranchus ocellatus]